MKKSLATFIIVVALFSCTNKQLKHEAIQETPKALQGDLGDTKSYSRSGSDLTEELYAELVGKTLELKKLESDIAAFGSKPDELNEKFKMYNDKSNSYYTSAIYHATAISDSLLKAKVLAYIKASENRYSNRTEELNSLMKLISKNTTTLRDHHSVLKIILTMPLIEKYQAENLPDGKEFKDVKREQENLIQKTDKLTPIY